MRWQHVELSDEDIENAFTTKQDASKVALRVYPRDDNFIEYTLLDLFDIADSLGYDMVRQDSNQLNRKG